MKTPVFVRVFIINPGINPNEHVYHYTCNSEQTEPPIYIPWFRFTLSTCSYERTFLNFQLDDTKTSDKESYVNALLDYLQKNHSTVKVNPDDIPDIEKWVTASLANKSVASMQT